MKSRYLQNRLPCHAYDVQQLEELVRTLFDLFPHPVFVFNERGDITCTNRAGESQLRISPGIRLERIQPELWQKIKTYLQASDGQKAFTYQINSSTFLIRLQTLNLPGRQTEVLCVGEDRTEEAHFLESLNDSQQIIDELESIIQSSPDGIWICNETAQVIRINPASERINNIKAEEVLGRTMHELIEEGFIDCSVTLEVLKQKKPVSLLQTTKDRKRLVVTGNPIFDGNGQLSRIVTSERNIGDFEQLKEELEEEKARHYELSHHLNELQQSEFISKNIIAHSTNMIKVLRQALTIAPTKTTILIQGETGSGKGLLANLIHQHSARADKPFIKINCGAIPHSLIESELFGYGPGAFTGANKNGKIGKFELAHGGTILLDEIGDLPHSAQVKLLQSLEENQITRLGETKNRPLDVRILAATNQDLQEMVRQNLFRKDLYYRLHVVPLVLPALRERQECIYPLIQHFLKHFAQKYEKKGPPQLKPAALKELLDYDYPGNIRELINICERLVLLSGPGMIQRNDLPRYIVDNSSQTESGTTLWDYKTPLPKTMERLEAQVLEHARKNFKTQVKMATALGLNQSTIARKLKKYRL
ncbi:MAG: sigma 54-interacting transcriptional regulator [Desulfohalobiaceae bacterium]|nr:sigma 54-interacting transcriptional regulator [Desulfohalobiaceae bacterium]